MLAGVLFAVVADALSVATPSRAADRADLFVAVSGSDAGSCTPAQPCRTLNRAYQVARPGQVVEVRAGEYPSQTIVARQSGVGGKRVVFRPVASANVTTRGLSFGIRGDSDPASNLTIDGEGRWVTGEIDFFLPNPERFSTDVTIENVKTGPNAAVYLRGTDRTTLRNVEIGPSCCGTDGMNVSNTDGFSTYRDVTNLTLDGVYMHDIARYCADLPAAPAGCVDEPEAHVDCIQFWSGVNVVIRNSRFYNCATSVFLVQDEYGGKVGSWTVENNMIGEMPRDASNYVYVAGTNYVSGALAFRNNTIIGSIKVQPTSRTAGSSVTVSGNIFMVGGGCSPEVTYSHNLLIDGKRCGPTDRTGDPRFVANRRVQPDLHIQRGSAAVLRGDPNSHPASDIDGAARPVRLPPDAGADQLESARLSTSSAFGSFRIGATRPAIEAAHGKARLRRTKVDGVMVAGYPAPAGAVEVYYRNDRAVALSTRSPYYSTENGIGVGSKGAGRGVSWDSCREAFVRRQREVVTVFDAKGKRKEGSITRVTISRAALAPDGWPLRCNRK
jgi:hypothetical protein